MKLIKGQVYKYYCNNGTCVGRIVSRKKGIANDKYYKVDIIKAGCDLKGACLNWYVDIASKYSSRKEIVGEVSEIEKELYGLK